MSWIRLLFQFRGSVLDKIWLRLTVTFIVAVVVTVGRLEFHVLDQVSGFAIHLTPLPFSLIAVALGIFLGFRNNTSYDRFWEGRKLWGRLVNVSRSFARQVYIMVDDDPAVSPDPTQVQEARRLILYGWIAYVHSLRMHLRKEFDSKKLEPFLGVEGSAAIAGAHNPPNTVLNGVAEIVRTAHGTGWVNPFHLPVLEASMTECSAIQGGCERILKTPIPFAYTVLLHRIVGIYCLLLPFGIVEKTGILTPLVVLMVAFAFFALDAIGDEIEDPFGYDLNDLPLHQLSTMIEIEIREGLGETDLPPPIEPVKSVLR